MLLRVVHIMITKEQSASVGGWVVVLWFFVVGWLVVFHLVIVCELWHILWDSHAVHVLPR